MSSWLSPADQERGPDSSAGADVWTVQKVLSWSTGWLKEKVAANVAPQSPRLDVELLLAYTLGCDRMRLYLDLDRPLSKDERENFKTLLRRRVEGEPIAYILGYRDFYRHRFLVNSQVLIPRADTEILVEQSLALIANTTAPRILDIGTGSGCIAISLGLARPDAAVTAWDISQDAIAIAAKNKDELHCDNLTIELCDARQAKVNEAYTLIVSNPPYIRRDEESGLSDSVKRYEPHLALFDDNSADGLSFYHLLADKGLMWLADDGVVVVECGHTQADQVVEIFKNTSDKWSELTITKDLNGQQRVVSARKRLPS